MWIVLAIVIGSLLGLVVLLALIGLLLPRDHVAARAVVLARPPDEVWRALTAVDDQVGWRRGLAKVEHLPAVDGKPSFREHTDQGKVTYIVDVDRPPAVRVTRMDDRGQPYGGRWIYELAPAGDGTRLTITEGGFIRNPVFRVIAKTVMGEARTIEQFIADLGTHLGVTATPEPATPSTLAD